MREAADVVVVGGGLAGSTAAVAAAREDPSATVRLVSARATTLDHASGLIDVLGYVSGRNGPLRDPFPEIPALPPEHPYSTVGIEGVRRGLSLFDDVAGDAYGGEHTDLNALVPTYGGATKPTARYPAAVTAGLAARTDAMVLVGFDCLTAFDAPFVADSLATGGVPFQTRGVTVRFPGEIDDVPEAPQMAAALDANEPIAAGNGDSAEPGDRVRTALAERVTAVTEGAPRVGFPAVLGETKSPTVRSSLAAALDAAVFEVPLGPPSVPGRRLAALFRAAMDAAGVDRSIGRRVTAVHTGDGRIDAIVIGDEDPLTIEAPSYVLATGGLAGGGIVADDATVREPLFDCHVPAPDDRADWFAEEPFGDHEFTRFGVRTDSALRPVDERGEPEYANLHAAGPVIGGYDWAAEMSGGGVSLATGHSAGSRAVESS